MVATHRVSDGNPDGVLVGNTSTQPVLVGGTSTSPVAFHGGTPTSQRASATLSADISLLAISGASYVAQTSATLSGLFGFNSGMMVQLWDAINEIRDTLAGNGLHKGSA